jgi:hypothetical protein
MAISLDSLYRSSEIRKPARVLIHGTASIGKTTMASYAPNPVFIQTEDGLASVDVNAFPLAKTFNEVLDALRVLGEGGHNFETVVIDSVDWLEPLIFQQVCDDNKWMNIETPGYGKGYAAAMVMWRKYIDYINYLRDSCGMWVVQIAHTDIKRFNAPDTEPYDRYQIKLKDRASELLIEHSDLVLFCNRVVSIKETDAGFNKKITRAVGGDQRIVHTTERPSHIAKSRYPLPDSIYIQSADWTPLWEMIHKAVGV